MKKYSDDDNFVVMSKMSRSWSKDTAKKNRVDLARLLSAIHVFHEVSADEYGVQDHPHMVLHSDGSGHIESIRKAYLEDRKSGKFNRCHGTLFTFHNLKELVKEADRLMEKHNIMWVE